MSAPLSLGNTLSVCGAHESPAAEDKDRSAALDARVDAQDCGGSSEGRQHSVCQFISESGKYSGMCAIVFNERTSILMLHCHELGRRA